MKQLVYSLLTLCAISLTVISCNKSNDIPSPGESGTNSGNGIVANNYCQEIDDWVQDNYPGAIIDSVLIVTAQNMGASVEAYEVHINNGAIVYFDIDDCTFLYEIPPANPCGCSLGYAPVCWNGTTYDNSCLAVCAGADPSEVFPGACGPCGCPTNYEPVCWDDTNYDNECLAICAGANPDDITSGVCSTSTGGCVNNAVQAMFAGIVVSVVNIVEGYSNVNYGNAYYEVTINFNGAEYVIYFDEDCNYYSMCGCAATISPVCFDGTTNYINQCEAECQENTIGTITPGPC